MAQVFKHLVLHPRPKQDDFDVPPLLEGELQTHRIKPRKEYEIKRLEKDNALAQRLVMDYFHRPSPQVTAFLEEGIRMEEQGELQQAAHLYGRVLCSEPSNLELRQYVNRIVTEINEQQSQLNSERRQRKMLERYGMRGDQQSLHLKEAEAWDAGKGQITRPVGVLPKSSPAQFRANLLAQAAEARMRRRAQFAEEDRLERKQLDMVKEQYEAAKYQQRVVGGIAKLQYYNELLQQRKQNALERKRLYEMEGNELRYASRNPPPGPLGGEKCQGRLPEKKQPHDQKPLKPHKPQCPQYMLQPPTNQPQLPPSHVIYQKAPRQAEQTQAVQADVYAQLDQQQQQHPQQQQQPRLAPVSPGRQDALPSGPQFAPITPVALPCFDRPSPLPRAYSASGSHVQRGRTFAAGAVHGGYPAHTQWQPVQAWSSPAGIAQAGYAYPPQKFDNAPRQQYVEQALQNRVGVRQPERNTAGIGRGWDGGGVAASMRGWVGSEMPGQARRRRPSPNKPSPHAPFGRPGVDRPLRTVQQK